MKLQRFFHTIALVVILAAGVAFAAGHGTPGAAASGRTKSNHSVETAAATRSMAASRSPRSAKYRDTLVQVDAKATNNSRFRYNR